MMGSTATQKLSFPVFLELIRLPVKLASFLPFAFGVLYAWYDRQQFDLVNTLIYFVGQMSIAMFVTGFNNVQDYLKSDDADYRAKGNIIGTAHLDPKRILALMLAFLGIACGCGLILVWRTNLSLLFIGGAAIFIAIFYTYGPLPISRLPIGEFVSGLTEGFGTIFIAYFVNVTARPIDLTVSWQSFTLRGDLPVLVQLFLVALPIIILTGNIMFANNICDIEEDITNHRYTLACYLGRQRALSIYPWLPVLAYGAMILAVILQLLPPIMLLILVLAPKIRKNVQRFLAVQVRRLTFNTAVFNLLLTSGAEVVILAAWALWSLR